MLIFLTLSFLYAGYCVFFDFCILYVLQNILLCVRFAFFIIAVINNL